MADLCNLKDPEEIILNKIIPEFKKSLEKKMEKKMEIKEQESLVSKVRDLLEKDGLVFKELDTIFIRGRRNG